MADEKKKKNTDEGRITPFLRKYVPRLYAVSLALFVLYMIVVVIINQMAEPGQHVYYANTLWILLVAGLGMLISSLLYVLVRLLRGFLMLVGGAMVLLCILTFLGPVISGTQASLATLRQGSYLYRISPVYGGSTFPTLVLLQCDSLGIICDQIETEGITINRYWDDIRISQLQFDESQNAILWLQDGEVRHTHPLE